MSKIDTDEIRAVTEDKRDTYGDSPMLDRIEEMVDEIERLRDLLDRIDGIADPKTHTAHPPMAAIREVLEDIDG